MTSTQPDTGSWVEWLLELTPNRPTRPRLTIPPDRRASVVGMDGCFAGGTLRVVHSADGPVSHLDVGTFIFTREPYDRSAPVPGGVEPNGWGPGLG